MIPAAESAIIQWLEDLDLGMPCYSSLTSLSQMTFPRVVAEVSEREGDALRDADVRPVSVSLTITFTPETHTSVRQAYDKIRAALPAHIHSSGIRIFLPLDLDASISSDDTSLMITITVQGWARK